MIEERLRELNVEIAEYETCDWRTLTLWSVIEIEMEEDEDRWMEKEIATEKRWDLREFAIENTEKVLGECSVLGEFCVNCRKSPIVVLQT
jgi:hypothetical protein